MSRWVRKGLVTGIKTTRYPGREEKAPGVSPGIPLGGPYPEEELDAAVDLCPTGALVRRNGRIIVNRRRCIHCFRCRLAAKTPVDWQAGYEWASVHTEPGERQPGPGHGGVLHHRSQTHRDKPLQWQLGPAFGRSVHILVVDAGDCGACLNEVKQLNNPFYNMHRLGFFITPTPRQADVMLVVGPVTDHMQVPLQKAYDAMPDPKRVIAVGACALTGGVLGPNFACGSGVNNSLPVAVEVPGQPPPPLAILHGLLVLTGRKPPASPISPEELDEL
jgi:Ni,Fe-hydrogenase III small subunit